MANGFLFSFLLNIDTWYTLGNAAYYFVADSSVYLSKVIGSNAVIALLADKGDDIACLSLGNVGNVYHQLVHADTACYLAALAVNEYLSL